MKQSSLIFSLAMLIMMLSCSDDQEMPAVSNDDAADITAASLATNTSGITVMVQESIPVVKEALEGTSGGRTNACGYTGSYSTSSSSPQGTNFIYNYAYSYSYQLACTGQGNPQNMAVQFTFSGDYDGPRISLSQSGSGSLNITALDRNATSYEFNGAYSREGSFASKVRNESFSNTISALALEDLQVNKETLQIVGGRGSLTISGTSSKGPFNVSLVITFNGNGTATAVINGVSYLIDLATGDAEKS